MKTTTSGPQRLRGTVDKRKPQPKYTPAVWHLKALKRKADQLGLVLMLVIYLRASTPNQKHTRQRRLAKLQRYLQKQGIKVVGIYLETACGRRMDNRPRLEAAFAHGHKEQADRPDALVALATDAFNRLMRNEHYSRNDSIDNADPEQLAALVTMSGGLPIATRWRPEMAEWKVKSKETKLGESGRPVNYPIEKRYEFARIRYGLGFSKRHIARLMKLDEKTIRNWCVRGCGLGVWKSPLRKNCKYIEFPAENHY